MIMMIIHETQIMVNMRLNSSGRLHLTAPLAPEYDVNTEREKRGTTATHHRRASDKNENE